MQLREGNGRPQDQRYLEVREFMRIYRCLYSVIERIVDGEVSWTFCGPCEEVKRLMRNIGELRRQGTINRSSEDKRRNRKLKIGQSENLLVEQ